MKLDETPHQCLWIGLNPRNVHTQVLGMRNTGIDGFGNGARVHYCSKLRYLMVACDVSMHDGAVAAFEALAPDYRALHERCKAFDIFAVMVTAAGAAPALIMQSMHEPIFCSPWRPFVASRSLWCRPCLQIETSRAKMGADLQFL